MRLTPGGGPRGTNNGPRNKLHPRYQRLSQYTITSSGHFSTYNRMNASLATDGDIDTYSMTGFQYDTIGGQELWSNEFPVRSVQLNGELS